MKVSGYHRLPRVIQLYKGKRDKFTYSYTICYTLQEHVNKMVVFLYGGLRK